MFNFRIVAFRIGSELSKMARLIAELIDMPRLAFLRIRRYLPLGDVWGGLQQSAKSCHLKARRMQKSHSAKGHRPSKEVL
jgi:hypothetical protein